ncbi:MAG: GGDEF domain-containing protein [Chloroflexi bacterium]|nr:GGDEF domain-containing protein [Chloroflexota bacterium]
MYDRRALSHDPLLLAAIRVSAHASSPEAALDELLEVALRLTGASEALAYLWDGARGGLAIAGSRGVAPDDLPALEAAAAAADHPVQLAATERLQTSGPPGPGRAGSLSAWPIVIGRDGIEEPVGALALVTDDGLSAEDAERVAAVADLIGLTVDRSRLIGEAGEQFDWIERVANSDQLTGLANARTLGRVIELEIVRAARQGSSLCVALFDVDGLSAINDRLGRRVGDDILREVAAVIAETVRYVDTVGRWGGDEFLLVAPGATGTTVARRSVEAVTARPIGDTGITVSAGLAAFPNDGATSEELIAAASAALREAQSGGPGSISETSREVEASGSGGNGNRA